MRYKLRSLNFTQQKAVFNLPNLSRKIKLVGYTVADETITGKELLS